MLDWLRRNMKVIFFVTAGGFILGGVFVGFGGYRLSKQGGAETMAEINGKKVARTYYDRVYRRALENARNKDKEKREPSGSALQQLRTDVIQYVLQDELLYQTATEAGISVTDEELRADIARYPAFQRDGRFDPQTYVQTLYYAYHSTPQQFEWERSRQIAINKLRFLITAPVTVTDKEVADEYFRRRRGNMRSFVKETGKFREEYLSEKRSLTYQLWFQKLAEKARVRVFLEGEQQPPATAG